MSSSMSDVNWTQKTAWVWSPGAVAKGQRQLIHQLIEAHMAAAQDNKEKQTDTALQADKPAYKALIDQLKDSNEALISFDEICNATVKAAEKRSARSQEITNTTKPTKNPTDNADKWKYFNSLKTFWKRLHETSEATRPKDDFTATSAKTYDQHDKGYWAGYYLSKAEEMALLESCKEIAADSKIMQKRKAFNNDTTSNTLLIQVKDDKKPGTTKQKLTAKQAIALAWAKFWKKLNSRDADPQVNDISQKDASDTQVIQKKLAAPVKQEESEIQLKLEKEKEKEKEEAIRECSRLALRKYKPLFSIPLIATGKFAMSLTAVGAGFSGCMVAMFVVTSYWALPALALIAGIVVFVAHFVLEIHLNRHTTPRTLLRMFHIGIFDDVDPKNPDSHAKKKVLIPLILSAGTAFQIGMLTTVGTLSIFSGGLLPAIFLGIMGFLTIGTLLFEKSYKIYKAPWVWWHENIDKLPSNDPNKKFWQKSFTAIALVVLLLAVVFYCYTIIISVFAFCPPLGYIFCLGLNIPAMLPFLMSAAFDIGQFFSDKTAWLLEKIPMHKTLMPLAALLLVLTSPLWLCVLGVNKLIEKIPDWLTYYCGDLQPEEPSKTELSQLNLPAPTGAISNHNAQDHANPRAHTTEDDETSDTESNSSFEEIDPPPTNS